jgi:hypothetical protein
MSGFVEKRVEERHGRVDPVDDQFAKRPAQARQRLGPVAPMDDQLADQAVVIGRDPVAVIQRAVHPHAQPARGVVLRDPAGAGGEVRQLLGVDPHLDGVAVDPEVFLPELHRQAGGHADLLAHEVDAEDAFGHRMFDLEAGVHLDEVELAVLVEELDGAGADVADLGHRVGADLADPGAGARA